MQIRRISLIRGLWGPDEGSLSKLIEVALLLHGLDGLGLKGPTKIKKDRINQHSPRCPDCFSPSVLSKLGFMFGKDDAKDEGLLNPL